MKIDWKHPRTKEDLHIPETYLAKDHFTQDRRELTFILQETAFSQGIPLYCTIDKHLLDDNGKTLFTCEKFEVNAAILLGLHVQEMLLFMEQSVPELHGFRKDSMAELWVKNRLLDFAERLAVQGYRTKPVFPQTLPDPAFAAMLAASGKGFPGKNGRFVTPDCGCRVCIGILLTDAPLMGGDYRCADYTGKGCGDCTLCIDACPASALSEEKVDAEKCREYREKIENQIEVAQHSHLKCIKCMEVCPVGQPAAFL